MSSPIDTEAITAAVQLIYDHYRAIDDGDYETAVGHIGSGAHIDRGPGQFVTGPDEMREAMSRRPADRSTCHIVLAPSVSVRDASTVSVRYLFQAWVRAPQPPGEVSFDVEASALLGIVDAHDELRRADARWQIFDRRYGPALR